MTETQAVGATAVLRERQAEIHCSGRRAWERHSRGQTGLTPVQQRQRRVQVHAARDLHGVTVVLLRELRHPTLDVWDSVHPTLDSVAPSHNERAPYPRHQLHLQARQRLPSLLSAHSLHGQHSLVHEPQTQKPNRKPTCWVCMRPRVLFLWEGRWRAVQPHS